MCFKYKFVYITFSGKTVTHPLNALTNFQQCTPSPEHIKPLVGPPTARHIGSVYEY